MRVCIQGEEMQTQLLLDSSPYVYKPAQLPLGEAALVGTCALAAEGLAHCYSVPAIANSSLMWHSQCSLPSHSQLV